MKLTISVECDGPDEAAWVTRRLCPSHRVIKRKADALDAPSVDDDTPAAEEAPPPEHTPVQAKRIALDLLRKVFAVPEGKPMVRALKEAYSVTKLVDVPDDAGNQLLDAALDMAAKLGVH